MTRRFHMADTRLTVHISPRFAALDRQSIWGWRKTVAYYRVEFKTDAISVEELARIFTRLAGWSTRKTCRPFNDGLRNEAPRP
jgi:hypothetical protein